MTITYDPSHPKYLEEDDLRAELERVFDLCHGCRLCFNLCPSFPTLFDAIDAHDGIVSKVTVQEQNKVIDECYQCKLCYIKCPYVPPHDWALDFPRLMVRANAVLAPKKSLQEKVTDQFLGRTDLLGQVSTVLSPIVNKISGKRGSLPRQVMQKTVGIHSQRLLPPYAKQRFSSWFNKRSNSAIESPSQAVTLFPTCFVEYMEPQVGKDAIAVLEHNNISCSLPDKSKCCGAPWLHNGNIDNFIKAATENVSNLAVDVKAGKKIIVAQPTCGYVIRKDYPIYVKNSDAQLVADNTLDLAEFLIKTHLKGSDQDRIKLDFNGVVPKKILYHLACHSRAQNVGYRGRDLLKLTGAEVEIVERCAGIDGTWGYRQENYQLARKVAEPLKSAVEKSNADCFCGDCHLANTAIEEETGNTPLHPISIMARAYGIKAD